MLSPCPSASPELHRTRVAAYQVQERVDLPERVMEKPLSFLFCCDDQPATEVHLNTFPSARQSVQQGRSVDYEGHGRVKNHDRVMEKPLSFLFCCADQPVTARHPRAFPNKRQSAR